MKIHAAQINCTIGDIEGNTIKILEVLKRTTADVILFPELTLTGYPPEDLLLDHAMVEAAWKKLAVIAPLTKGRFVVVGLPRVNSERHDKPLYNSAAIFIDGELVGFKDKTLLPTYDVFDEQRYFQPGSEQPVFTFQGKKIAVLICEDCWQHSGNVGYSDYARDPVMELTGQHIDLLLNLSASPYYYKRTDARLSIFRATAKTLQCPVLLCNQIGANDQLVFDGHSLFINEEGDLVKKAKGFEEDDLIVDLDESEPIPSESDLIGDLYAALVLGVKDYFQKQGFSKAFLGLSGGIDSALVACIAKDALGAANVTAIAMPSRYSSASSYEDAAILAKRLGIALQEISIDEIFQEYLNLLGPLNDLSQENLQPRIRGMILMAHSNNTGSILLNAGNKSEMAMGYCTLYGDMAGGLGVIQDLTKHYVYELSRYIKVIPESILNKVPTAELKPNQTDFDTLPRYEILDPILEDYLEARLQPEEIALRQNQPLSFILEIIRKIHAAEYKRRQAPIGIRVTQKAFSKGRVIPIVQKWTQKSLT